MSDRPRNTVDAAKRDLAWLFGDAIFDACNLVGVSHRMASAFSEGLAELSEDGVVHGGGSKSRRFRGQPEDIFPDEEASSRRRLRDVSAALARLPTPHKAVLEARFDAGRPRAAALGLEPEEVEVACLFRDVVALARQERITTRAALRRVLMTEGPESIRADVSRVVDDALAAYCRARWG